MEGASGYEQNPQENFRQEPQHEDKQPENNEKERAALITRLCEEYSRRFGLDAFDPAMKTPEEFLQAAQIRAASGHPLTVIRALDALPPGFISPEEKILLLVTSLGNKVINDAAELRKRQKGKLTMGDRVELTTTLDDARALQALLPEEQQKPLEELIKNAETGIRPPNKKQ